MTYKVTLLKSGGDPIDVEAKYILCENSSYFFYNKLDQSDLDAPIAVFKQDAVLKIIKMENEENGERK